MASFISPISSVGELNAAGEQQGVQKNSGAGFQQLLSQAVGELEQAGVAAAQNNTALALGNVNDLAQVQIDAMKAQTLLQTTVQLTSRMVNAYKEIMQMQI